jgi:hypothetical protein
MTSPVTALHTETVRARLLRVDEMTDENSAEVTVTLDWKGERHVGTASGDPSAIRRASLVATATLRAIDSLADGERAVAATGVATVGGHTIAIVVVDDDATRQTLIGSSLIEEENQQIAFAKASLDATNRSIRALP